MRADRVTTSFVRSVQLIRRAASGLIEMVGSELGIIVWPAELVAIHDSVRLPNGRMARVEVYDDEEHGARACP
jgi:hypothetical protein